MTSMGKTRRTVSVGLCGAALAAALAAPAQAHTTEAHDMTAPAHPAKAHNMTAKHQPTEAQGTAEPSTTADSRPERTPWKLTATGTDARFRGLAAVSRDSAWVAGSKGTVLRTTDGGRTWRNVSPPGAAELEFRDIEAFDTKRAVVLAIGEGEASRLLRTDDGGATWSESFRNTDPKAFYDCVTFFDRSNGLAMSDPVDGKYRILATGDGGKSWKVLPSKGMPDALPGEAGFAASGQCLVSSGPRDVWLATGGGATARVLHSADRGLTWTATESTIPAGDPARGVFALAFQGRHHGIAVGGDYRKDQPSPRAGAVTRDGGRTWQQASTPPPAYRSGVAWLPHSRTAALAVGPTGTDLTLDGGRSWRTVDTGSYDTVDCTPDIGCWAAGEKGRVARLGF
ncbi:WD40/YVTN/BNR-like repeat-containing protein [Streptomyces purpureus]|uniref:WD40/YVTN/BNR-like repeat-containing protein n=1 Tax=Streptomyces purpureus TaxID=1951 RepID=UPI00059315D5|nr:YCF48-related protein [Streptomyces purpureus]